MEFIRKLEIDLSPDAIRKNVVIGALDRYCRSISEVLEAGEQRGVIYCLWGQFEILRELSGGGVKYILPKCPNQLYWSLTAEKENGKHTVLVKSVINTDNPPEDFRESIEMFMDDWVEGLSRLGAEVLKQQPTISGSSTKVSDG